jgi:ubiquinone/menaquinone biosynthesis C-methylase UbiE
VRIDQQTPWSRAETRAFFAGKAATWETKYGDDLPLYADAVARTQPPRGGVAIDVGCGTGRALPPLRAAVGADGTVIGFDVTDEMLAMARQLGRQAYGLLALADADELPLRADSVDVIFAAGLLGHVARAETTLTELARVARHGAHLALFHPVSRAALANRRGYTLGPDDLLAEAVLRTLLARTGWDLRRYDDAHDRFYALAFRLVA